MRSTTLILLFSLNCLWGCDNKPVEGEPCSDVKEVFSGSRIRPNLELARKAEMGDIKYAVAGWWGFHPEDSTEFLQAAIDSGAQFLLINNMGSPWVVRPLFLKSDQYILFEPGVVIEAKRGAFLDNRSCLISILNQDNIVLEGRGAILRMHKEDYTEVPYSKGQWRHCLNIRGCRNISISGLTLADSGGDGIYIGRGAEELDRVACRTIEIVDCQCVNNHRQGMSVIAVEGLLVERCVFRDTSGTKPMTGIDFEPNRPDEPLKQIMVRGCVIENNEGGGLQFWLDNMTRESGAITASVKGCTMRNNGLWSLQIHGLDRADAPGGRIRFNNNNISGLQLVWKHPNTKIFFDER